MKPQLTGSQECLSQKNTHPSIALCATCSLVCLFKSHEDPFKYCFDTLVKSGFFVYCFLSEHWKAGLRSSWVGEPSCIKLPTHGHTWGLHCFSHSRSHHFLKCLPYTGKADSELGDHSHTEIEVWDLDDTCTEHGSSWRRQMISVNTLSCAVYKTTHFYVHLPLVFLK